MAGVARFVEADSAREPGVVVKFAVVLAGVSVVFMELSVVDWVTEEERGRCGRREVTRTSRWDCRSVRVERRFARCVSGEVVRVVEGAIGAGCCGRRARLGGRESCSAGEM